MSRPEIGTTRAARAAGGVGMSGDGGADAGGEARRSPYGRPVIKEPVWSWEIPLYFYTGGLAGASAGLAFGAGLAGNDALARRSWAVALAGVGASPPLLIGDLGKPSRFLNMLRVFKVTSPMSVGSWVLTASGAAIAPAALNALTGRLGGVAAVCRPLAAGLGLPLSTYTAVLVADTAVPAWHSARRMLPFVFGASAAASAGGLAAIVTPHDHSAPARRLAVVASLVEVALTQAMEQRLGSLGQAYSTGPAGRLGKAAKALGAAGAAVLGLSGRRSRAGAVAGGAMISGAALAMRWSVFKAGSQSAADPDQTVVPQRERIEAGHSEGASRRAQDGSGARG